MQVKRSDPILLSSAYFPSLQYFRAIVSSPVCYIDGYENYQKQSYRNRCYIMSANGVIPLIVPVIHNQRHNLPMRETVIDYSKPWQVSHWRTIVSAYNSSPFFEYYKDDIEAILAMRYETLFDLNNKILSYLITEMCSPSEIRFTDHYYITNPASSEENEMKDFRSIIHPKKNDNTGDNNESGIWRRYFQVFEKRHGFVPNLSILDLLFNEGVGATSYLLESES